MNPLALFGLMLKAALFSFSGTGNVPILYADLLARHWATDRQFAEALAIGQISPGPTGLWVLSLGYLIDGPRGGLLALVAIVLPPVAVLLVDRVYRRIQHLPSVEGFVWGVGLAVAAVFAIVLLGLLQSVGVEARGVGITLASIALLASRRVPVGAILGLAALAGLALYR